MNVAAINDEIVRHLAQAVLCRAGVAERDNAIINRRVRSDADFEADQAIMMRRRRRLQRRHGVGRDHFRHRGGVGSASACAFSGQRRKIGRANDDPVVAALGRQNEVAREDRAGFEHDLIAGLRLIERGLQVSTGSNVDHCACADRIRRVEVDARQLRLARNLDDLNLRFGNAVECSKATAVEKFS